MSNELRTPTFQKSGETVLGQIQFLTFWDFAHLSSVHDVPGAVNHLNGSSVGMGVRYNLRSNLTAKADYGWQLQHLPTGDGRDQLVSFGLMMSY
jgi:hemolysin activation/secretion protein